jgi:hypothetical protein
LPYTAEKENCELVIEECYILAIIHVVLKLKLCTQRTAEKEKTASMHTAHKRRKKERNEIKLSLTTDIQNQFPISTSATTSFLCTEDVYRIE